MLSITLIILSINLDFQIRTIDIDDKRCKLQVWDTAGQDRFKSVVKSFYRGAHGVIICFDITDFQSFRGVDNWFQEVSKFCQEETPVYLVGTKADLESQRTVPNSTIQAYADQKNLSYIETSSKTSENIDTCFTNFARELVQHSEQLHPRKKDNQKDTNTIIPDDTKPVETKSRCFGGEKCTI